MRRSFTGYGLSAFSASNPRANATVAVAKLVRQASEVPKPWHHWRGVWQPAEGCGVGGGLKHACGVHSGARFGCWTRSMAPSPSLQVPPAMSRLTLARQASVWDPHRAATPWQASAGCYRPAPRPFHGNTRYAAMLSDLREVCAPRTVGGSQWPHSHLAGGKRRCLPRYSTSRTCLPRGLPSWRMP